MLYQVWRKNDYFKMGDFYRLFDDGCEKCITRTTNGRLELLGYSGIVVPFSQLEPYVIRVQQSGVDSAALSMRQTNAG